MPIKDIVTLEEYKAYATINSPNQDSQINALIPAVTEYIKSYCNRRFIEYFDADKVEVFSGGTVALFQKEWPLVSITSLEYSDDRGKTFRALEEYTDFVYDMESEMIRIVGCDIIPKRMNGYKLTYKAGFEDYPKELKLACMDTITYYMKGDMAVKSTRGAGSNTTQIEYVLNSGLPSNIRRILDLYRSEAA